jgi:glycosyltransferase involved in cell wall biosynthesis
MNKPAISIITIVYNGLPFLKEAVGSVLKQEFEDWELLISDDGSTDGSREFLDSLTDTRITVFKQEKNLGIFDNLNFLFDKAKAPLSQILCQDDYFISTGSLGYIIRYWEKAAPGTGFVRFNHNFPNGKQLLGYQDKIIPPVIKANESATWLYTFGNIPGNLSNVSVRTALITQQGGFNQALPYAGDFEFWCRLAAKVDLGIDRQNVIYIRRHPGVASNFLNRKGELLVQMGQIISSLYNSLVLQYPEANKVLKIHGTLNYDVLPRDTAVKRYFKGDKTYLERLNNVSDHSPFAVKSFGRWVLFIITAGGRIGRGFIARKMMRQTGLQQNLLVADPGK